MRTLGVFIVLVVAGCVSPVPNEPGEGRGAVEAGDNFFGPKEHRVGTGEEVTWENVGRNHHTVTIQDPDGDKGDYLLDQEDPALAPGDTVSFVFDRPGTYDVFCRYHAPFQGGNFTSGMVMKVVVAA